MIYYNELNEFCKRFISIINEKNKLKLIDAKSCINFYISTSTSNINFRKIIESTSISNFDKSINGDIITNLKNKNYISQTTLPQFANGHFITIKGLVALYYFETNDVNQIMDLFDIVDKLKLKNEELIFKKEELLLVVFFIACNATSRKNALHENTSLHSKYLYDRLKVIEAELNDIVPNFLKSRINFNTGKKISWTRYLGEIRDLSKTGIYFKEKEESQNRFYLSLEKIKSVNTLFKLCFSHLDTSEKIALMNYISRTNIKIKISMSDQVSNEEIPIEILNKFKD
jgi:hypothetical protein